ncbi:1-phosphofructokinase [Pseudomonas sp. Choline-3u-10]|jgi:1-phosphofructokinase|uniref:1-phosphofructokinase n=2 Tax=Pseudomonadales TaxID=72274 RepID=UPI0006182FFB|nr:MULTISPECIES: 1-phosphofructokinase [Pseudomonadaceae]MBU0947305.1 1-phosphofructokinase [Gammaproteobacteria bacterium]HBM10957.1 1-phosphofructokinase [Pseudomonas sp.]KJJ62612.1 1-phosphofructokinase [Pseudomonas sp. 10B238]MBK3793422.1 1-phosphofructokinase [Stutzerimonas stutzeri]MBK3874912.1 1-phosphofructokinase [Stutzerimonas stutzeri]|tara:strand:+ start:657 stop:1595 length:939 start_codon:yes stop_codon:yes gene_type:complete
MARVLTVTLNPALDLTVRLPSLRVGEVNRSDSLEVHAAGKGLNVAQVLADLGHQLTVTGFLGEGNPQAFEQLFAARGFADEFVRVAGDTRSNIKLAEADGQVTDINGPGLAVSDAHRSELLERIKRLAPAHELVVVAGSLPRGVNDEWFVELLRLLKQMGTRVALDTSGAALRVGLATAPWLIKPNEEELAEARDIELAEPEALAQEARRLQVEGIEHVVVSQGADGVSWFAPGAGLHAYPPKVRVVSTVGAGDSLLAGMLHGLLEGWPAERTLTHATAIAAQAVGQVGFGITDTAQLAELQAAVRLQPLSQ